MFVFFRGFLFFLLCLIVLFMNELLNIVFCCVYLYIFLNYLIKIFIVSKNRLLMYVD